MDMDYARALAIHKRVAVRVKQRAVARHRGAWDVNPMLIVSYDDGTHYIGKPINSQMGDDFNLAKAIALDVFNHWMEKKRRVERIITVMDAYVQKRDFDDPSSFPERGDLGRAFRDDPNANVTEGMVTSIVWLADDGDCRGLVVAQEYRLSDGGVLAWGEPQEGDEIALDIENVDKHGQALAAMATIIQATKGDD